MRKREDGNNPCVSPLNAQRSHWDKMLSQYEDMFGSEESYAARYAANVFKKEGVKKILELGGGQGRDTLFFAGAGFEIFVLDYSKEGLEKIEKRVEERSIKHVKTLHHDIRHPLPFPDASFDGCYSHMLYCMALTTSELISLSNEILRVLKPGGINIYTARNTSDAHYRKGVHHGEDLWETGGFIVHFFSLDKVYSLSRGYEILSVDEFQEGELPRRLYLVTLKKPLEHR